MVVRQGHVTFYSGVSGFSCDNSVKIHYNVNRLHSSSATAQERNLYLFFRSGVLVVSRFCASILQNAHKSVKTNAFRTANGSSKWTYKSNLLVQYVLCVYYVLLARCTVQYNIASFDIFDCNSILRLRG